MSNELRIALMHAEALQAQKLLHEEEIKRQEKLLHEKEIKKEKRLQLKELQKDVKNLFQWTVCPMKYSCFSGIAWATTEGEVQDMLVLKYKHLQDYRGELKMSISRVNPDDEITEISQYIE